MKIVTRKTDGSTRWAWLAEIVSPKAANGRDLFYRGYGDTEDEAKENLAKLLKQGAVEN